MATNTRYVHCQKCSDAGKPFKTYVKYSQCPICGSEVGYSVVRDTTFNGVVCRDWSKINENRDTVETGVYTGLGDSHHFPVSTKRDIERAHDNYNRAHESKEEYVRAIF